MTKPCERPGCPVPITHAGKTPSRYARLRFHSTRCAALYRHATGWIPIPMTPEQRLEAGRKGGLIAGERRRRAAVLRVSQALQGYITPSIEASLSARDLARVKALLARAWNDGRTAERSRCRMWTKGRAA